MSVVTIPYHKCDFCARTKEEYELARFDIPLGKYSDGHQYVRETKQVDVCIHCVKHVLSHLINSMADDRQLSVMKVLRLARAICLKEADWADGVRPNKKKIAAAIAEADDCI